VLEAVPLTQARTTNTPQLLYLLLFPATNPRNLIKTQIKIMVPSISNSETKPVTVLNIVTHLNSEKHFPAAKDLDLGLVKAWMRALNIGLSNQAVKMLAPKVLEELFILE
jgi:hypothetical protein